MILYICKRALLLGTMLLGLLTIMFDITQVAPGDPARLIAGRSWPRTAAAAASKEIPFAG